MERVSGGRWAFRLVHTLLAFSLSGCVYLVAGGVGAVGGYVVSPDTVEGVMEGATIDAVWDTATDVLSVMGIIEETDEFDRTLTARVQGTRVVVTLRGLGERRVEVRVKARKALFPKIRLAQDVYLKIERRLPG